MAANYSITKDASSFIEITASGTLPNGNPVPNASSELTMIDRFNSIRPSGDGLALILDFIGIQDYIIYPAVDTVTIGVITYAAGSKTVAELRALIKASTVFLNAGASALTTEAVEEISAVSVSQSKAYTDTQISLAALGDDATVFNKLTPTNFDTPVDFDEVVINPIANTTTTGNFPVRFIFLDKLNQISTIDGYVKKFSVKLTNAEVGRVVRFYVFRLVSGTTFTCLYDSGNVSAELNGVNTFSPAIGDAPISANDYIACYCNPVSTNNSFAFRDSGGTAIAEPYSFNGTATVGQNTVFSADLTSRKFAIEAEVVDKDLMVARRWANKPYGYAQLDNLGNIDPGLLPSAFLENTTFEATTAFLPSKNASGVIKTSGELQPYSHYKAEGVNYQIGNSTFAKDLIVVNWNGTNGFSKDGLLNELRIGPVLSSETNAKIQAWVVRPTTALTGTVGFKVIAAIGEIDASIANRWHVFKGLTILVKTGDMIASRGIGITLPFSASEVGTIGYNNVRASVADLTLNGVSTFTGTFEGNSRSWAFEADILNSSALASNSNYGLVRLNGQKKIENTIGRIADMYWQTKKIMWYGTSIPANYNAASYPAQVGGKLDAEVVNESVGSSGVTWNGGRALSLSATIAELTASHPGNEAQSYQNKLIGKNADLYVFDHGFNDREVALGTIDSTDKSTFYGAMNFLIAALFTDKPSARIAFITPPSKYTNSGADVTSAEAIRVAILALASKYQSPVYDLMLNMGIGSVARNNTFSPDTIHPSQTTTDKIANNLYHFIKSIS